MGILLKCRFWLSRSRGTQGSAFPASSQGTLMPWSTDHTSCKQVLQFLKRNSPSLGAWGGDTMGNSQKAPEYLEFFKSKQLETCRWGWGSGQHGLPPGEGRREEEAEGRRGRVVAMLVTRDARCWQMETPWGSQNRPAHRVDATQDSHWWGWKLEHTLHPSWGPP